MQQINKQTIKQSNSKTMYNQGSALIITILLVTVLASIAFSTSRLTISEIVQTGQLEDSELAYQAAEGCIETGLLLYRYNRDAEMPAVDGGMSSNVDRAIRYDITEGVKVGEVTSTSSSPDDKAISYCDLRMWHHNDSGEAEVVESSKCDQKKFDADLCVAVPNDKTDEICGVNYKKCYQDTDNVYYIVPALAQDQVVEYDVEGMDSFKIKWDYLENPKSQDEIEKFQLLNIPVSDQDGKYKELLKYDDKNGYKITLYNDSNVRLKSLGGNLLYFTILNDNTNIKLDSKYTYIESVGYYGSAKRKLKISLDRTTQTLLSPYDFIIYSSEEKE